MVGHRRNLTRRGLLVAVAAGLAGCGRGGRRTHASGERSPSSAKPAHTSTPPRRPSLPGGGRTIYPGHRLFGYCGSPAGKALGQLGMGPLGDEVTSMLKHTDEWGDGEKVMPIMELIATIAQGAPGPDGMYRGRIGDARVDEWLRVARKRNALLLINIQPGRAAFLDEVKHYQRWLQEPDVGLALDPEWSVGPGQVPGKVFGHVTGSQLGEVAAWLAHLVDEHDLPQKPMVYHVLRRSIVRDEGALEQHAGVAIIKSVDGIGARIDKTKTYRKVMRGTPKFVHPGFKLFFQEDAQAGPLMTPSEVLALAPRPEYVLYE